MMTTYYEAREPFLVHIEMTIRKTHAVRCDLIFCRGEDDEYTVSLRCTKYSSVLNWQECAWFQPSYVDFDEDGNVNLSIEFSSPESDRSHMAFLEALWEFSINQMRPLGSKCELAQLLHCKMDELSKREFCEIDPTLFFGLLF